MINKLKDALEEFFQNTLKDGIKFVFDLISSIFTSVFDPAASGDVTPAGLITYHPVEWMGGSVWTLVKNISDNVILPIGGLLMLCVLVAELIQIVVSENQFETVPLQVYMKWFLKMIVGIYLVSMVFDIVSWLFGIGVYVGQKSMTMVTGSAFAQTVNISVGDYKIGTLILLLVISIFVLIGVGFMVLAVIVTLAGRMIEIFMYFSIAPIPMATAMSRQWSSVGSNWIKGVAALAFQGFFVIVAIAVFAAIFGNVINSVNAGAIGETAIVVQMFILLGYTLTLCFTILRSAQIAKSVFSAS